MLAASVRAVAAARPVIFLLLNGMFWLIVVWPSFIMAVEIIVARSAVSALNTAAEISVLATTGCPDDEITAVPLPLRGMEFSYHGCAPCWRAARMLAMRALRS